EAYSKIWRGARTQQTAALGRKTIPPEFSNRLLVIGAGARRPPYLAAGLPVVINPAAWYAGVLTACTARYLSVQSSLKMLMQPNNTIASPLWFNRAKLAQADHLAVEQFHIPIASLMENAGAAVARAVESLSPAAGQVLLVCGPGNNGGDALVAARHLHRSDRPAQLLLTAPPSRLSQAALQQLAIIQAMALPVLPKAQPDAADPSTAATAALADWLKTSSPHDIIIDGFFGTGLSRPVLGPAAGLIDAINKANRRIVSVDIPSGLDCDTGQPLGAAIRATLTVSFCGPKVGFASAETATYTGTVITAAIGFPQSLLESLAVAPPKPVAHMPD
ncbi:MAG: NAD(P)H-hydrate epimerase, partial [Phycisphaerales bacterium]|nr:NAD(P)H-hydrate epimerase [Phycisphaerales bacterium]